MVPPARLNPWWLDFLWGSQQAAGAAAPIAWLCWTQCSGAVQANMHAEVLHPHQHYQHAGPAQSAASCAAGGARLATALAAAEPAALEAQLQLAEDSSLLLAPLLQAPGLVQVQPKRAQSA